MILTATKIWLLVTFTTPDTSIKFHCNPNITFWVMVLKDRQTDKERNKLNQHYQKHNLLWQGGNWELSDMPFCEVSIAWWSRWTHKKQLSYVNSLQYFHALLLTRLVKSQFDWETWAVWAAETKYRLDNIMIGFPAMSDLECSRKTHLHNINIIVLYRKFVCQLFRTWLILCFNQGWLLRRGTGC